MADFAKIRLAASTILDLGLKTKSHGPMDCLINNFPKKN